MLNNRPLCYSLLLILTSSCTDNTLWTQVKEDMSLRPLTIDYVEEKLSPKALYSITNERGDTLKQIANF